MTLDSTSFDVVVIGGGLAGLTAAAYLARGGRNVAVFERASGLGGRARTNESNGFLYNRGPHAFYRGGEGSEVLAELGIGYSAGSPNVAGSAVRNGRLYSLPVGGRSLMTTRLFGMRDRVETARLLLALRKLAGGPALGVSVSQWLDSESRQPAAKAYVEALVRLSTYANAPETIEVSDAARQFAGAGAGVHYIDGGWVTLVDGLRRAVESAGGTIQPALRVERVERGSSGFLVRVADGRAVSASVVVAALSPAAAAEIFPGSAILAADAASAVPARAACLDVSVSKLPSPRRTFALGIDSPLYFSVHTKVARLAPEGRHTLSVAKYLHPTHPHDPVGVLAELEAGLDLLQPGWRAIEVGRQYLPEMTVTTSVPRAADGGMPERHGPAIEDVPGLFVAGDWVGNHGWLANGVLGSAREAARMVEAHLATRTATPDLAAVS